MKCSICFQEIPVHPLSGWSEGNNAAPVNDGRCCDRCNDNVVIPARLEIMFARRKAIRESTVAGRKGGNE